MKAHIKFEVISGVEGRCLALANDNGGYRLAGPKPWGGGKVMFTFTVDLEELMINAMRMAVIDMNVPEGKEQS